MFDAKKSVQNSQNKEKRDDSKKKMEQKDQGNSNPAAAKPQRKKGKESQWSGLASQVMKLKRHQSRYERPIYAVWELFSDYSEYSTIHGVRYIGEKKRHWSERLWWLIVVISSVILCSFLVSQTWLKWQNTPVIVTFSEQSTPVYEIPFPSVTICTDIKIQRTKFKYGDVWHQLNNEKTYKNYTETDLAEKLYLLSPLCDRPPKQIDKYMKLYNLSGVVADADARFFSTAKKVSPTLSNTLLKCTWRRRNFNCSDLFHEVLTNEGICFSFNYLNASELYNEQMINENFHLTRHNKHSHYWNGSYAVNMTEDDIYPRRVLTGSEGLRVELLLPEFDIDYVCSGPVQSFKILLHSADDIPQMRRNFYRIPLDHDIVMAVRPNIMNTTKYLIQNYSQEKRKCVDAEMDNRKLMFFKKYTQRNCQLNQLAFRTFQRCNCVTYGMPRFHDVSICRSSKELGCAKYVETALVQQILNHTALDFNCLPACRSISYDAEMSMSRFDRYNYEKAMNKSNRQTKRRYSRVLITFKDEQFFSSRRAEVYTLIDFIANCGGILGLFMGISILSIVEMVYFSTLRLGCSLRKRRLAKKRRQQQIKIIENLNDANNQPHFNHDQNNHVEFDKLPNDNC